MAETKPSGRPVIEGSDAKVAQEVAYIDKKGLLNFLPRWTSKLTWLADVQDHIDVLLVYLEPGRISIRDPDPDLERIRDKYRELSNAPSSDFELLRLIQDRYGVLHIPKSKRASLGDPALLHLGIVRGIRTPIYVAIYPSSLELISVDRRAVLLSEVYSELSDLPYSDS